MDKAKVDVERKKLIENHIEIAGEIETSISSFIPPEPDSSCEHSVTLCIKLPNSERVQRKFDFRHDQIKSIIYFAHSQMDDLNFKIDRACLSDSNVPMNLYTDYTQTLCQAGLTHNTILHYSYN